MKRTSKIFNLVSTAVLLYAPGLPVYGAETKVSSDDLDKLLELNLIDLTTAKVTVASKKEEQVSDAPGIISIVTAKEIEQFGAKNLKDVLNRVPSIQGLASHFYSNIISLRGQLLKHSNNEILFLVNGRPHRTSYNGGTNSSLLLAFPLHTIERIEVIRGPGSVLYGSGAFSGVVNIVTKSAKTLKKTIISAEAGSFGGKGIEATTGWNSDEVDIISGIKAFSTNGWKFKATGEKGVTDSIDMREQNTGVVGVAKVNDIQINALYTESEQDNMGSGARWPFSTQDVMHLLLDLGYTHSLSSSWDVDTHVTLNRFDLVSSGSPNNPKNDLLLELTMTGRLLDNLSVMFGGVHEQQDGVVSQTINYSTSWSSLYAQMDYAPGNTSKLTAGVQWNKPEGVDPALSPRLAFVSNFSDDWGTKLLYAEAYRSAYATERFVISNTINGTPDLKPERIATMELQLFYHTTRNYAALTYFHSDILDVITREPTGGGKFSFVNSGKMTFDGIELEGTSTLTERLSLTGSVTYQQNEDDAGVKNSNLAPNLMAKLGFSYENPAGYSLGIFNTYFSKPKDIKEIKPTVNVVNPPAEAYNLLTANIKFNLFKIWGWSKQSDPTITFYIDNLLDEDIYYPEINRKNINSIPIYSGRAIYGILTVKL